MLDRKQWSKLESELSRLRVTLNSLFVHCPTLYRELPAMRDFLVKCWKTYSLIGMALNNMIGVETIRSPLEDKDFAKCMAFLLFIWKVAALDTKRQIITILQEVERKTHADTAKRITDK